MKLWLKIEKFMGFNGEKPMNLVGKERALKEWRVVPFLKCWGVWLARNQLIFEDEGILSF
jgi:hypothetical protein